MVSTRSSSRPSNKTTKTNTSMPAGQPSTSQPQTGSRNATPAPSASARTKNNKKGGRGQGKKKQGSGGDSDESDAIAPTLDQGADFVDLTMLESSDVEAVAGPSKNASAEVPSTGDAMKSSTKTSSKGKGKGKANSNTASAKTSGASTPAQDNGAGKPRVEDSWTNPAYKPAAYQPSAFKPFKSLLVGVAVDANEGGNDDSPADPVTSDKEDGEIKEEPSLPTPLERWVVDSQPAKVKEDDKKAKEDGKKAKDKESDDAGTGLADTSGLLLPDHVLLGEPGDTGELAEGEDSFALDGIHVVDDDRARGVPRYFDEEPEGEEAEFLAAADVSKVCRNCKKTGHRQYDCPHTICQTCGAMDEHERRDCPFSVTCFGCGQVGHRRQDCPNPSARTSRSGCERCGAHDHKSNSCPLIWRVYVYRKEKDRAAELERRAAAQAWEAEAIGGPPDERWCYNCAKEGHLGDDCPQPRGSLARPALNSAFSARMAGRGPYASEISIRGRASGRGEHKRFDDAGLPHVAEFKGADAGRKAREREKDRAREREREQRDDYDDWFDRRGSGGGGRARSRSPPARRGRGDYDSPPHQAYRGYGADRRSEPARIAFGKMTAPGSRKYDSPAGRAREWSSASAPGTRPGSGPASGTASPRPRRKNDRDRERDFESNWRASGAGGGNVSGWGVEMGLEMPPDERPRAGPQPQRGRAKGQRYMGGY